MLKTVQREAFEFIQPFKRHALINVHTNSLGMVWYAHMPIKLINVTEVRQVV